MDIYSKEVTVIVMASGLSRRMGQNKLLLPYKGQYLIDSVFQTISHYNWRNVIVVSSYEEIRDLAAHYGYIAVDNPYNLEGQSQSMILGIRADEKAGGYLFFPGDQPFISQKTISRMLGLIRSNPSSIIRTRFAGKPSLPVYFPSLYSHELLKVTGDQGGRAVFKKHPEKLLYLDVEDPKEGFDIDTINEFQSIL